MTVTWISLRETPVKVVRDMKTRSMLTMEQEYSVIRAKVLDLPPLAV